MKIIFFILLLMNLSSQLHAQEKSIKDNGNGSYTEVLEISSNITPAQKQQECDQLQRHANACYSKIMSASVDFQTKAKESSDAALKPDTNLTKTLEELLPVNNQDVNWAP